MSEKNDETDEEKRCPSCEEVVEAEDDKCDNCGEVLSEEEQEKDEDEAEEKLNLEEKMDKQSESIKADGLSSLGQMIEEKVMTAVKQREERIKDSMKKTVREREKEIREKMQDRIDKEREKKEEIRNEFEDKIERLREKIDEKTSKINELKEKHAQEKEELREKLKKEKEELRSKLKEEKLELRYSSEKEKVDLKNRLEREIEHLQERLEDEKEKGGGSTAITGGGSPAEMESLMGRGLSGDIETRLKEPVYPFPAIVGQERMKRALLLNAINPSINGVLIWGEEGCGKRTTMIALAELLSEIEDVEEDDEEEVKIWNDRERYIGGTIHSSKTDTKLMVDTVLKNGALNIKRAKSCEKTGTPRITVNTLSPSDKYMLSYLEEFNLQVKVDMIEDIDKRREIIKRYEEYQEDPQGFYENYEEKSRDLRDRIVKTRQTLNAVTISPRQRNTISNISAHASLPSGSDIILEEVARTVTAYDGREEVKEEDIQEAVDVLFVSKAKDFLDE